MFALMFVTAQIVLALWLIATFFLKGKPHGRYDSPGPQLTQPHAQPSAEHLQIVADMRAGAANMPKMNRAAQLAAMRKQLDSMGAGLEFEGTITPVRVGSLGGEWVCSPDVMPQHRLLYVHGGAFTMGSPLSHRAITTEYARRLDVAVLAIDYRLMPEHQRQASIDDSQAAYRWILDNGPDGAGAATSLIVSGDSAGGNLTLMLSAWARDAGLRAADAVVALSPATDSTFGGPSLLENVDTDVMLGPLFGTALAKTPKWIMLWGSVLSNRIAPANPIISPLLGDLAGLPPTLLHASTAEMLLSDSVRYANKAVAQGSAVELATWPFMLHVWHAFVRQLPEAVEAFDHIEAYLRREVKAI